MKVLKVLKSIDCRSVHLLFSLSQSIINTTAIFETSRGRRADQSEVRLRVFSLIAVRNVALILFIAYLEHTDMVRKATSAGGIEVQGCLVKERVVLSNFVCSYCNPQVMLNTAASYCDSHIGKVNEGPVVPSQQMYRSNLRHRLSPASII